MTQRTFRSLAHAVEVYYDELRRFVLQRTGSAVLADEVVQETWVRANTTSAAMPVNPRAYLYRMASNLAIDHLRKDARRTTVTLDQKIAEEVASPSPAPDAVVSGQEEVRILSEALDELPEKCREVFLLYRGRGLTMREIAEQLGISHKTVEKHIARAMVHCRQTLKQAGRSI